MKKIYLRNITAAIMSIVMIIPLITFDMNMNKVSAASDLDLACEYAMEILYNNEGSYTSVNKNDSGAVSVGKLQWHATNALDLLKAIIKKNESNAKTLLGTTLYNEITTKTDWEKRTVNDSEAALLKKILGTTESKAVQDSKGRSFIMNYINEGAKLGIANTAVLVYYADMRNQGPRFAKDMASIAKTKAGSYAKITLDIIHEVALANQNPYFQEKYWNGIKNRRIKTYNYCKTIPVIVYPYVEIAKGQYFIKNSSTGTYINGSSASDGGAISLAAKKNTNAFKFNVASGSKDAGYILTSSVNTGYVLNPYSDTPGDGTKITLYSKSGDGTQNWKFEKSGNGYIIHNAYNQSSVLTASGTGVVLKSRTAAANQIWYLESTNALSSISISTAPSTTVYENGTAFSASGMVVTAKYSNGTTKAVTGYKTTYDFSKAGNVNVTVSYTENGVTKTATQAVTVQDVFKGSGTEADPYQISTADDLNNLAKQINNIKAVGCYGAASYIQTADIKVGTMAEPIGTCYADSTSETISLLAVFKGHYNGNFHKLYDVKMDYARSYAGIFGKTGGASVVENLEVCGEIRGVCYIGGIIGEIGYGATIKNCSFNGIVNADSYLGGIVGRNINGGKISGCYANARVTANNGYAGGISGYVETGGNESATNVLIENCYFTGKSIGTCCGAVAGGVVIDTVKQCTVTFDNCYFLDSSSKDAVNSKEYSGCTALDSASLKKSGAKLLGTPFVKADTGVNDGYPVFEWQNIPVLIGDVDNNDAVTVADAVMLQKYLVKSVELDSISTSDMDGNGRLNIFDIIMLKRMLIEQ